MHVALFSVLFRLEMDAAEMRQLLVRVMHATPALSLASLLSGLDATSAGISEAVAALRDMDALLYPSDHDPLRN